MAATSRARVCRLELLGIMFIHGKQLRKNLLVLAVGLVDAVSNFLQLRQGLGSGWLARFNTQILRAISLQAAVTDDPAWTRIAESDTLSWPFTT